VFTISTPEAFSLCKATMFHPLHNYGLKQNFFAKMLEKRFTFY